MIAIDLPPWLYAKTRKIRGLTGLVVYRSIQCCRDEDETYRPVKQLLETTDHVLLETRELIDKSGQMFALCELSLYALGVAEMATVILEDFLIEMQAESARFLEV